MKSAITLCCVAVLIAARSTAFAGSGADHLIKPGTPEAAQVTARLEQARHLDRMNARSYTGGDDSEVGIFYSHKAREVEAVLNKLHAGKTVSAEEVKNALDNSKAVRLGGSL